MSNQSSILTIIKIHIIPSETIIQISLKDKLFKVFAMRSITLTTTLVYISPK